MEIHTKLKKLVNTHETSEEAKRCKNKLYEETCLRIFINGLRGQIGISLCMMKPETLEDAYEIRTRLETKFQNDVSNNFNKEYNSNSHRNNYYNNNNNNYNRQNNNNHSGNYNSQNYQQRRTFLNNRQPNFQVKNHQPFNNQFQSRPNMQFDQRQPIEPMDTTSGFTRVSGYSLNSGNKNGELFYMEDPDEEICENFHEIASRNKSDT